MILLVNMMKNTQLRNHQDFKDLYIKIITFLFTILITTKMKLIVMMRFKEMIF
jgi:hypothetical protein